MDIKTFEQIANNPNFEDKALLREIAELLESKPEAIEYLYLYGQLVEVMDDLADEHISRVDAVNQIGLLRCRLSSCAYWLNNWRDLWMTERLIHHQYNDVLKWERDNEDWKRVDAKVLSHCAYNMFFAVLQLEFGDETVQKFSLRFREHAHLRHINDLI